MEGAIGRGDGEEGRGLKVGTAGRNECTPAHMAATVMMMRLEGLLGRRVCLAGRGMTRTVNGGEHTD